MDELSRVFLEVLEGCLRAIEEVEDGDFGRVLARCRSLRGRLVEAEESVRDAIASSVPSVTEEER